MGDGFWRTARIIISAAQAYDLPDPTGPIIPRTKALLCRNSQTLGERLKSRFRPMPPIDFSDLSAVLAIVAFYIDDVWRLDVDANDRGPFLIIVVVQQAGCLCQQPQHAHLVE